jgi:tetratricopeptide (TPR) repeat protein
MPRAGARCRPTQSPPPRQTRVTLMETTRFDGAINAFRQAIRALPDDQTLHANLGLTLRQVGRFDEAIESLRQALSLDPGRASHHNAFGLPLCDNGQIDAAIESMRRAVELSPNSLEFRANLGMMLLSKGEFRAGWDLTNIPHEVLYVSVDNALIAHWRDRIGAEGFKVGIAWQGNPNHGGDRLRSIPLREFAPLAEIPDVRLISLQKQPGAEQIASAPFAGRVETPLDAGDAGPEAMLNTAAAMMNCDVVVSSCTMTAHLAGALACPLFVALRRVPDWRWLMDRDDSPWYPTAPLFRQERSGDWAGVVARIATAVRSKAALSSGCKHHQATLQPER